MRDRGHRPRLTAERGILRSRLAAAGSLGEPETRALRRVLYSLYALVKTHFAKEEETYLTLLDAQLTPDAAGAMFAAMEDAARAAKQAQTDHARAPA